MDVDPAANELPVDRAFVVQFSAGADLGRHRSEGRVEHVLSGERAHFHTLDELVGFMARLLADAGGGRVRQTITRSRPGRRRRG